MGNYNNMSHNVSSGVTRTELFLTHTQKKILKTMPRYASKIGATLQGKNLLPEGAKSFL